ncbi:MAG: hypothetical protein IKD13_06875, partial [Firmicutes bacterium]|nr:hypothetical protein [Bacillota bacterium]
MKLVQCDTALSIMLPLPSATIVASAPKYNGKGSRPAADCPIHLLSQFVRINVNELVGTYFAPQFVPVFQDRILV